MQETTFVCSTNKLTMTNSEQFDSPTSPEVIVYSRPLKTNWEVGLATSS